MPPLSTTRMRLERLVDERERTREKMEDGLALAEEEKRDLADYETEQIAKYRERVGELDAEIEVLTTDLERAAKSRDVSALIRGDDGGGNGGGKSEEGVTIYRTFAEYARDDLTVRFPLIAEAVGGGRGGAERAREVAADRLQRVQNTLTGDVAGLLPTQYLAEIMDIINTSRPASASGRSVPLDRGKLAYPRITGRPQSLKQAAEKTEAGTAKMSVTMDTINADTYLGGGDLSWQTIQWSSPDALQLWFELAGEAYAQATEAAACSELGTAGGGTISTPLGTTGTESFQQWRAAAISGLRTIYNATGGRAKSNVLWLSADRFFQLASLGTDQVLQVSSVGNLDIGTMTGTWAGLRVVGTYGFGSPSNAAIVGDTSALLIGETAGSPVQLRAVEPAIGGMEVGVIGAYRAKVFDPARFIHLS
jgi:HK97 family phage major capsid protein